MSIRLLVACREEHVAQAHCAALVTGAGGAIAALGTGLDELIGRSALEQPDVILLQYLPAEEERVWSILHRLSRVSAGSHVLMLCDVCTDRLVTSFIGNGACGCVAAAADASLWAKAAIAVHRGEIWFARTALLQALRGQLSAHFGARAARPGDEDVLTAREREILALIGAGMSNKEIARALDISDQTVKTHLHHIYVKLNKSGRYKAFAARPAPLLAPIRVSAGQPAEY